MDKEPVKIDVLPLFGKYLIIVFGGMGICLLVAYVAIEVFT